MRFRDWYVRVRARIMMSSYCCAFVRACACVLLCVWCGWVGVGVGGWVGGWVGDCVCECVGEWVIVCVDVWVCG